jgi:hypothetical protein
MKRSHLVLVLLVAMQLLSQAPPAFEIVSIKVHSFESADRQGPPITGNRFTGGGNCTLTT